MKLLTKGLPFHQNAVRSQASKKERLNRLLPYIIAFCLPFFSMVLIFIGKGIYPFGNRSFLRIDLYHQYAPFFQEFNDKISSGESLFYTWDIGLGTNYMAIYAYYLSSPVNWLLLLIPRTHTIEFITYTIAIKMALSSVSLTYYLNRHNHTNSISAAFFGTFYGMSGYMAAYSWNIMWLDCMVLLPVILLGLERLVKEDKCFLYSISLGLCIVSNYYISIMVCISLVIYFMVQVILLKGNNINYPKKLINFALFSLLAGGLAAVVLMPEIAALSYTASANSSFPKQWTSYFSMFDMLSRHLLNVQIETGLDHWPNIYCGVAVLLLVPLYYMNKKVSFREKMCYTVMLCIFLLSFSTNKLNYIWHGFHYPNSLPARQSFIYIALLLSMCYKGMLGIKERNTHQITGSIAIAFVFIIAAEKLQSSNTGNDLDYSWFCFYLSLLFCAFYGGFIYLYNRTKTKWKTILSILAICTIAIESIINMAYTSVTTINRDNYIAYDDSVRKLTADALSDSSEFFRIEKVKNTTKNDGAWLDYHSASIFSSTAYSSLTAIYKKLGLESSTNAYGTKGSSIVSNMLLGIKYSLYTESNTKPAEDDLRTLYESCDNAELYLNNYTLGLGFGVDSNLNTSWQLTFDDPALNWNNLAYSLGLDEALFMPVTVNNNNTGSVTVTAPESGYYYFYASKSGPKKLRVSYGSSSQTFENLDRNYFMNMDYQSADTEFTITTADTSDTSSISLTAYRLDEDVFKKLYDILNQTPMNVTSYSSTRIDADISAENDCTVVTTIPFDKGWSVYVDGKKTETEAFEDAFVSFSITSGSHDISMKYTPEGFYLGLIISFISAACLFLLWRLKKLIKLHAEASNLLKKEISEEEAVNTDSEAPAESEPNDTIKREVTE